MLVGFHLGLLSSWHSEMEWLFPKHMGQDMEPEGGGEKRGASEEIQIFVFKRKRIVNPE